MSSGGSYKQRGVQVKPTSRGDIRTLANKFRKLFDLHAPRLDTCELLEETLHGLGVFFHVDDPARPLLAQDEHACAFPDDNLLILSQNTYDDLCNEDPRARFTLAHEIGHLVMHGSNVQGYSRKPTSNGKHKAYCDSEWQADTFAAELLMPAKIARGMNETQIIETFGVSSAAANIRVKTLKKAA